MTNIKMTFDPDVAKKVGTDSAIILSNIEYWQQINKANNRNLFNGKYWTYNSIKAYNELFNYLTPSKIRTCLCKLEDNGYILSDNFNKSNYDRTKWYCSIRELHLSEIANGDVEIDKPIPNNKPNDKPTNKPNTEVKGKMPPPSYSEFEDYALEKIKELDLENLKDIDLGKLKLKYESWKVAGWETGKGVKIKNWKTTLLNTLPYLKKEKNSAKKENEEEMIGRMKVSDLQKNMHGWNL